METNIFQAQLTALTRICTQLSTLGALFEKREDGQDVYEAYESLLGEINQASLLNLSLPSDLESVTRHPGSTLLQELAKGTSENVRTLCQEKMALGKTCRLAANT